MWMFMLIASAISLPVVYFGFDWRNRHESRLVLSLTFAALMSVGGGYPLALVVAHCFPDTAVSRYQLVNLRTDGVELYADTYAEYDGKLKYRFVFKAGNSSRALVYPITRVEVIEDEQLTGGGYLVVTNRVPNVSIMGWREPVDEFDQGRLQLRVPKGSVEYVFDPGRDLHKPR